MSDILRLRVRQVLDRRLGAEVARAIGVSYSLVHGRLSSAHGRTVIANLFKDCLHHSISPGAIGRVRPSRIERAERRQGAAAANQHYDNSRTINRVRQEFTTSCGVAVVAMLADVSHERALAFMFPTPKRQYLTRLADLTRALDHFGVSHAAKSRRISDWASIPSTAIVGVRWRDLDGRTIRHWVVFQRRANGDGQVLDPDPPRDKGTLRLSMAERRSYEPTSYLEVAARSR